MSSILQELNAETASIVEDVGRALVQVRSGRGGTGAGTLLHADGFIVTNAHVVRRPPLTITLTDGRTLPARLLAHDATHDLSALVVNASGLPTVRLGESRCLQPGQWVLALGHPWGVLGAATAGVVIGWGSEWPETPRDRHNWVVVNLHLRPGYSGGPLMDGNGRLVGINTMVAGPGVGMAVPVHIVKAFLRETLGTKKAVS